MQMLGWLVFSTLFWSGIHYYMGRRLISPDLERRPKQLAWGLLIVLAALPLLAMYTGRLRMGASGTLATLGFAVLGLSSIMGVFVMTIDGLRLLRRGYGWIRKETPVDPERRAFLGKALNAAVVGSSAGITAVGYAEAVRLPQLKEVDVPVDGLPEGLEGFKIVQLTDVHVGQTIGREYLQGVVDMANEQEPDLVAVTGDFVDGYVDDMREQVAPIGELRSRHGAYFVTGNHEYYWDGPAWCAEMDRLGLTVLTNEHRVVDHDGTPMVVAGITDHRTGARVEGHATDPVKALAGAPAEAFKFMLAHQPRSAHGVAEAGADLMVCGHTHGGQYFPMTILVHIAQPYVAGLHLLRKTWVYVSRGTGYWGPPNRLGSRSEVTLLRLRRA